MYIPGNGYDLNRAVIGSLAACPKQNMFLRGRGVADWHEWESGGLTYALRFIIAETGYLPFHPRPMVSIAETSPSQKGHGPLPMLASEVRSLPGMVPCICMQHLTCSHRQRGRRKARVFLLRGILEFGGGCHKIDAKL